MWLDSKVMIIVLQYIWNGKTVIIQLTMVKCDLPVLYFLAQQTINILKYISNNFGYYSAVTRQLVLFLGCRYIVWLGQHCPHLFF